MKNTKYVILAVALLRSAATALSVAADSAYEPYTFTTVAGLGSGRVDETGNPARFNHPSGVAVDSAGNAYVADRGNHTIRKVTPAGIVTTLAGLAGSSGSVDAIGNGARFSYPTGVAVDKAGIIYVADRGNGTVRKVTPQGAVTTLAGLAGSDGSFDGKGSDARFGSLIGVTVDSIGNVYLSDLSNSSIRKVTKDGWVTTLAGGTVGSTDGLGSQASFGGEWRLPMQGPSGLAVDGADNVYVADAGNFAIRKVTPDGWVTTLAGLHFSQGCYDCGSPYGVAVDSVGNIYAADNGNNTISKLTPMGVVTTLGGMAHAGGSTDGTGTVVRFNVPLGLAVDTAGNLFLADTGNNTIRKGSPALLMNGSGFRGNQFGFSVAGPADKLVVVESSSNLKSWMPLWTNTVTGALNFTDAQSSYSSNRFYRARLP